MGDDFEGFQLVRSRKFRNKCKHKNIKLPAVDHCDDSTNIPAKLPHLMTSIQNCRLELDQSNFRKDFEETVLKAGILTSATEDSRGDDLRLVFIKAIGSHDHKNRSYTCNSSSKFVCSDFKIKQMRLSVWDWTANETVLKAGILTSVTEDSRGDDSLRSDSSKIEKVVSYGIGKYATCPIARYQFAFLSILCELLKIEKKNCFLYDPQFSSLEREGVLNWGFQLIDVNEEGKRRSDVRTLFYMLHCGKALYNNLVWANWNPVHLNNTIVIGNSFTGMLESLPEKEFKTELYCISKAIPLMTEFSIPNTFVHKDIFNSTSLHIFCAEGLQEKTADQDTSLWPTIEEPKYNDSEIITAQL